MCGGLAVRLRVGIIAGGVIQYQTRNIQMLVIGDVEAVDWPILDVKV